MSFAFRVRAGAAIALAVAAAAPVLRAQSVGPVRAPEQQAVADSALDTRTAAVATQLRCPVCQGESIQESPSSLAQEMRSMVRDQLRAGKTPDEVKAFFVSKYGEWILLEPRASGFNLLVYILPFAVLLGGAAVIFVAVRRWTRAAAAETDKNSSNPTTNQ